MIDACITAIEQRKDDTRRLKKRYTIEMYVHLARMFYEATKQGVLLAKHIPMTLELLYQ